MRAWNASCSLLLNCSVRTPVSLGQSRAGLRPRRFPPPLGPRCHLPRGRPPRDRPRQAQDATPLACTTARMVSVPYSRRQRPRRRRRMASTRPPQTYSPSFRTGRRSEGSGGVVGMVRCAGCDAWPGSLRSSMRTSREACSGWGAVELSFLGATTSRIDNGLAERGSRGHRRRSAWRQCIVSPPLRVPSASSTRASTTPT